MHALTPLKQTFFLRWDRKLPSSNMWPSVLDLLSVISRWPDVTVTHPKGVRETGDPDTFLRVGRVGEKRMLGRVDGSWHVLTQNGTVCQTLKDIHFSTFIHVGTSRGYPKLDTLPDACSHSAQANLFSSMGSKVALVYCNMWPSVLDLLSVISRWPDATVTHPKGVREAFPTSRCLSCLPYVGWWMSLRLCKREHSSDPRKRKSKWNAGVWKTGLYTCVRPSI